MNLGPETEYVEHKKSTGEHREACESIASMLNKHGHGTVYFGVRNDGEVVGQDVAEGTVRDLGEEIERKVSPKIRPRIEDFPVEGTDKRYIRVEFEGADAPYSCDGRYRVRVNDRDVLMTSDELERAFAERANRREPWDGRPSHKTVADLAKGVVERYVARGNACGRIPEPYTNDSDALVRLGLAAPDGTLTNAAAVLFCDGRSGIRLTMGVLAGNDKVSILDLRHESGPVFDLIDRAEYYVFSNVRRRLVITGAASREEVPEVPRDAVREAVTNALCHRDYESGQAVEVNVYMDSVEVSNPGLFPPGDTPERHLSGESVASECRNPLIAEALFRAGMIERYGSGIMRIKGACDEAGVPLSYAQRSGRTSVSFARVGALSGDVRQSPAMSGNEPETACESLPAHADEIIKLLSDRGSLSATVIAGELSMSRSQVQRVLKKMLDAGVILKSGATRSTTYSIRRNS